MYRLYFLKYRLTLLRGRFWGGKQNLFSIEQNLFAYIQSQFANGGGGGLGTGDRFIPTIFKKILNQKL